MPVGNKLPRTAGATCTKLETWIMCRMHLNHIAYAFPCRVLIQVFESAVSVMRITAKLCLICLIQSYIEFQARRLEYCSGWMLWASLKVKCFHVPYIYFRTDRIVKEFSKVEYYVLALYVEFGTTSCIAIHSCC